MFNPNLRGILYATAAAALVSGCGANDIASPGTGGNVTINNPPAPPPPPPPPPPVTPVLVTPAGGCPTIADPQGLTDAGTISGPTGQYRVCSLPARINTSVTLTKVRPAVSASWPCRCRHRSGCSDDQHRRHAHHRARRHRLWRHRRVVARG